MSFTPPGHADALPTELVAAWNTDIEQQYAALEEHHTRFFALDPAEFGETEVTSNVAWPGDPLEPTFCVNSETVRALCDSGVRGRQALHNEYCEYAIVSALDAKGQRRPKRVQVTTELREYWLCLAVHDPDRVRSLVAEILGREPSWHELYGASDPHRLDEPQRRVGFATVMAGHGDDPALKAAGVPSAPTGTLNSESALFMAHRINGLDDLLFIVLFGARPFVVADDGVGVRPAGKDEIFAGERAALACRHADPTAALQASAEVLAGHKLAFADPLGMYIRPFNESLLQFEGKPVSPDWIRFSRGDDGMRQRLEVGPGDDDDAFLDDIEIAVGQKPEPLRGGYQLVKELEVGPRLAVAKTDDPTKDELVRLPSMDPIDCASTGICAAVHALQADLARADAANPAPRQSPA